jgi:hypothetical protein
MHSLLARLEARAARHTTLQHDSETLPTGKDLAGASSEVMHEHRDFSYRVVRHKQLSGTSTQQDWSVARRSFYVPINLLLLFFST